jgi:hypothetical protein
MGFFKLFRKQERITVFIDVAVCEVRVGRNHSGPYGSFPTAVLQIKINYFSRQTFKILKCYDDLVLMAKEETVLQGMIDKLIEIGRCYDMEMNVEKKILKISRQPSPVTIVIYQKQQGKWNVLNISVEC